MRNITTTVAWPACVWWRHHTHGVALAVTTREGRYDRARVAVEITLLHAL